MAGWRARGYVADSDEEEDSQTSIPKPLISSQENHPNIDDIKPSGTEERLSRNLQADRVVIENEQLENGITGRGTGEAEEEHVWDGTSSPPRLDRQESDPVMDETNAGGDEYLPIEDFEDIDELQQDHYNSIPSLQLEGELKKSNPIANSIEKQSLLLARSGSDTESTLSSPLSVVPSPISAASVAVGVRRLGSENAIPDPTVCFPDAAKFPQVVPDLFPSNETAQSNRQARSLRHRNAIQLHPYLIESEKYRQSLKARGLRPLRMDQESARALNKESQDDPYHGEESQLNDAEGGPPSSGPTKSQDPVTGVAEEQNDVFVFADDELPDMNTLLQNPSRKYVTNGFKRRKTALTASGIPSGTLPGLETPRVMVPMLRDADGIFDVPVSPPLSESEPPLSESETPQRDDRARRPKFKMPKMTKGPAAALPTPVTSSEPRRRAFRDVSDEESLDDQVQTGRPSAHVSNLSDNEGSLSENEPSNQLQREQRRIRGVLPASWLKLDLKSQKKRPEASRRVETSLSPERVSNQRGVARPVAQSRSKSMNSLVSRDGPNPLADQEDSNSAEAESPRRPPVEQSHSLTWDGDDFSMAARLGEAQEDDQVDAMLPTASRMRAPRRREEKRRKANLATNPSSENFMYAKENRSQRLIQPRISDQFNKGHRRKTLLTAPKLSILDAPSLGKSPLSPVPRFLKIASRTTRSRQDKGRHSPTRKYIRLATRDDDYDTNETLRDWREGTIAPLRLEQAMTANGRKPLQPRSGNGSRQSENNLMPDNIKDMRSTAVYRKPMTSRLRTVEYRNLQTSLDDLLQSQHRDITDRADNTVSERTLGLHHMSKKPGQIAFPLQTSSNARPAMLESAREGNNGSRAQAGFQRDLAHINHFDDRSGLPNVLRLFEDRQRRATKTAHQIHIHGQGQQRVTNPNAADGKVNPRRSRKRQPTRMELPTPWSRAFSAPIILDDFTDVTTSIDPHCIPRKDVLCGLGPFAVRYSVNFDVNPLPTGTCFHDSTLLGGGTFTSSLKLSKLPRLDSPRGFQSWIHDGKNYRWGPWNDTVSSELGEVIKLVNQAFNNQSIRDQQVSEYTTYEKTNELLRMVVGYFSNHLSFLDPIDRISCIQRSKGLISTLPTEFLNQVSGSDTAEFQVIAEPSFRIPVSTLVLIFANQVRQIAEQDIVPRELQAEIRALVQIVAQKTLKLVLRTHLQEFEDCLSRFKDPDPANYILKSQRAIEAFIVTQHVYSQQPDCQFDVMRSLQEEIATNSADGISDVRRLDQSWKKLFTLLPFLEFDATGILETGRRFKVALDNWTLVKGLVSPVLEASLNNPRGQSSSFNGYCRALFARCLHLIHGWGWRRCDAIIGTLFDFFARNNLGHLRNEESHGSPLFLEQLDRKPSLNAEPEDRCFHILLKIIGSGLMYMRSLYTEKKMRDIVWRLMPNHGRFHPKEEAIRQEDLDALRNHHDLLCTLYWASPASCRPRLTVIRNLVQLESSHREACHINIRAWLNLVKFQLSTHESAVSLEPFAEWHDDLLQQILRQHALARTEAEEHIRSVQYVGALAISQDLLESTIAKNQCQVEAILNDALVSLKLAIVAAPSQEAATVLMSPKVCKVFELFDARRTQSTNTIIQSLECLSAYVERVLAAKHAHDGNDDSQEYGDWAAFDDDSSTLKQIDHVASPLQTFQEPLRHLLSNCFGADQMPEDNILLKVVDAWVAVAQLLVRDGNKSWGDYVDRFGNDTWSSLRDTEQTRKYTAYFAASLLESNGDVYRDQPTFVLTTWIKSLVERESLLKFQHRLTEALLNAGTHDSLLKNLPFSSEQSNGSFQITAAEFSERRLSVISSVLSNMRMSLEQAVFDPAVDAVNLRHDYKNLLKDLMEAMKLNYQELGNGLNARGAYVDFVHQVVEFLQQHTSTICPIDRFFTENGAFPLPAADPTYVVGQLKHYALRLRDLKTPKQLAAFLQSVSERAAVDGQQPYLVSQLHTAMSNAFEDGVVARPTLRSFIVQAVIPAYTGLAFTTESGWILVLPYLQALHEVFAELFFDLDGCSTDSVSAVASIITAFLDSVRRSLGVLLYPSSLLEEARVLKTISAYYTTITSLLPVLDYLTRLSGPTSRAISDVDFLKSFANYTSALLKGQNDAFPPEIHDIEDTTYAEIRNFASQELRDTLTKNWVCHDGQYYIVRGASRREVVVDVGLYEEEKQQMFEAFRGFFECLAAMPALRDDDDDQVLDPREKLHVELDELGF